MRMKSKTQHANITGMKRKKVMESEAKLSKVQSPSRKNNVFLKGEFIEELKEAKEKYLALEEKSKENIKKLETENSILKNTNKKLSDEIKSLEQKVQNLEAEKIHTHKVQ